ncbi:MAG: hypothetical protein R3Y61_01260 [Rikenellaceae bacterium]
MKKLLFLLILPLFIFSCEKEEISNASYDTFLGEWSICSCAVQIDDEVVYVYPSLTFKEENAGRIYGYLPSDDSAFASDFLYIIRDGYIYISCSEIDYQPYYDGQWKITSSSDVNITIQRDTDTGSEATFTLAR